MVTQTATIQHERDALACLGLLAHAFEHFDVPVEFPDEQAPSHVTGLNIHALIIDNCDGELLAIDRNTIHGDGSPLSHGEQRALRTAISRVAVKRPRPASRAIEAYYRSAMFYAKGTNDADFLSLGATLYTTLEPCPYCASALLVSRMKRVCYVIPDNKYGGAWTKLKDLYYSGDHTNYMLLGIANSGSAFATRVGQLHKRILAKGDALRLRYVRDTHILDFCREELAEAFDMLRNTTAADLASSATGDRRNTTTLENIKRALAMPYTEITKNPSFPC